MTSPTPYSELNSVLRELIGRISQTLGDNFLAAYLQGSFALGDFDEHSDCDFVIVIHSELSEPIVNDLQLLHHQVFNLGPEWAKHLEGSYFPELILRDYTQSGTDLWYLDNGHSELARSDHCNTLVVRQTLRDKGVILSGPAPTTLIEPIPVEALRREIFTVMHDWRQEILADPGRFSNRFYQTFIVLSYCRMLHDLQTGEVGSKRAGTEWAKQWVDQSWFDLIDRAWLGRPNPAESIRQPADRTDFERTLEFAGEMMRVANDYAVSGNSQNDYTSSNDGTNTR